MAQPTGRARDGQLQGIVGLGFARSSSCISADSPPFQCLLSFQLSLGSQGGAPAIASMGLGDEHIVEENGVKVTATNITD
jgi:hypothetical protein